MEVIIFILLLGLAAGYAILHPFKSAKLLLIIGGAFLLGMLVLCVIYWAVM